MRWTNPGAEGSEALKGHGFSRADQAPRAASALAAAGLHIEEDTVPRGLSRLRKKAVVGLNTLQRIPQGLKPCADSAAFSARLKPCPFKVPKNCRDGNFYAVRFAREDVFGVKTVACCAGVRSGVAAAAALVALAAFVGLTGSMAIAQAPAAPPPRFVVVLDAAHGGDDAGGKLDDGHAEKLFTLAFSVRLRSLLGARGIQVITTREQDENVDMNRRAEIADHAGAQACLSLHGAESGSGVHLYISSLTPAQPARFPAWKTAQAAWVPRRRAGDAGPHRAAGH